MRKLKSFHLTKCNFKYKNVCMKIEKKSLVEWIKDNKIVNCHPNLEF